MANRKKNPSTMSAALLTLGAGLLVGAAWFATSRARRVRLSQPGQYAVIEMVYKINGHKSRLHISATYNNDGSMNYFGPNYNSPGLVERQAREHLQAQGLNPVAVGSIAKMLAR